MFVSWLVLICSFFLEMAKDTLAVLGASGSIGSLVCENALVRGCVVYAFACSEPRANVSGFLFSFKLFVSL